MFLSAFFIFVRLYRFVLLLGCVFVFFCAFCGFGTFWCFLVRAKSFCKKKIKSLKVPSFMLLLPANFPFSKSTIETLERGAN